MIKTILDQTAVSRSSDYRSALGSGMVSGIKRLHPAGRAGGADYTVGHTTAGQGIMRV